MITLGETTVICDWAPLTEAPAIAVYVNWICFTVVALDGAITGGDCPAEIVK
jgi:hypothetical protein